MKKNTASQVIGAQMIAAADGSAFTGAVTVYVTGDAGTQAAGSVGAGACTHEGNGFHTYAPAQAETNYDHVAFTFVGSGAIPSTVQVYTTFPQTGDNFARLGAPAGASVSADIAAVKTQTAAIEVDTQDIQSRLPAALVSGRIDASVGAMAANVMTAAAAAADLTTELQSGLATAADLATVAGYLDTEIAAILADTNELQTDWANGGRLDLILDARASQVSVDAIDDFVDTEVAAIKAKTDNLPADPADASDIAASFSAVNSTLSTIASYIDTEVAAIKVTTDRLETMIEVASGSPGDYEFRADALRNAPTGSGGGGSGGVTDWTDGEREQIRHRLGIDGTAAAPAATPSLSTAAAVAAVAGYVDTEVAAILAAVDDEVGRIKQTTDKMETMFEGSGAGSPGDYRLTGEALAKAADVVLNAQTSAHATVGTVGEALRDSDLRGRRTVIRGTVGTATSPSTTQFTPSALSPAGSAADQFKGRIIVFDNDTSTAALRGQATDITASSAAGLPLFTFTALTTAPGSGDSFSVL